MNTKVFEEIERLATEEAKNLGKKYYKTPMGVVFFEAKKVFSLDALGKLDEEKWNDFSDWLVAKSLP